MNWRRAGFTFLITLLAILAFAASFAVGYARVHQGRVLPGVEVMTKAGIFATIVEVHDQDVLLEIAPGTRIRMLKAGIGEVITPQVDDTPVEDRPDFGDDDKPKG